MALSRKFFDRHVESWEAKLKSSFRPYRTPWPRRAFRHEPVETAARILQSGEVLSRNDADRTSPGRRDIAAPDVIRTQAVGYDYVRLYFRPLNPTQFWVEGVRATDDRLRTAHAPVLVMLVFDAEALLTSKGTAFSNGNLQRSDTQIGDDEAFFERIPWSKVYHDGGQGFDETIKAARCAEILIPSPLGLGNCLDAILCRSTAERAMLLHLAGPVGAAWSQRIRVHQTPGIFYNDRAYVASVEATHTSISVTFNHQSREPVDVKLTVTKAGSDKPLLEGSRPLDLGKKWRWEVDLANGEYLCRIYLHGCLAYEAPFFLFEDIPF